MTAIDSSAKTLLDSFRQGVPTKDISKVSEQIARMLIVGVVTRENWQGEKAVLNLRADWIVTGDRWTGSPALLPTPDDVHKAEFLNKQLVDNGTAPVVYYDENFTYYLQVKFLNGATAELAFPAGLASHSAYASEHGRNLATWATPTGKAAYSGKFHADKDSLMFFYRLYQAYGTSDYKWLYDDVENLWNSDGTGGEKNKSIGVMQDNGETVAVFGPNAVIPYFNATGQKMGDELAALYDTSKAAYVGGKKESVQIAAEKARAKASRPTL